MSGNWGLALRALPSTSIGLPSDGLIRQTRTALAEHSFARIVGERWRDRSYICYSSVVWGSVELFPIASAVSAHIELQSLSSVVFGLLLSCRTSSSLVFALLSSSVVQCSTDCQRWVKRSISATELSTSDLLLKQFLHFMSRFWVFYRNRRTSPLILRVFSSPSAVPLYWTPESIELSADWMAIERLGTTS